MTIKYFLFIQSIILFPILSNCQDVAVLFLSNDTVQINMPIGNDTCFSIEKNKKLRFEKIPEDKLICSIEYSDSMEYGMFFLSEAILDTAIYYDVDRPVVVEKRVIKLYYYKPEGIWIKMKKPKSNEVKLRYFLKGKEEYRW